MTRHLDDTPRHPSLPPELKMNGRPPCAMWRLLLVSALLLGCGNELALSTGGQLDDRAAVQVRTAPSVAMGSSRRAKPVMTGTMTTPTAAMGAARPPVLPTASPS